MKKQSIFLMSVVAAFAAAGCSAHVQGSVRSSSDGSSYQEPTNPPPVRHVEAPPVKEQPATTTPSTPTAPAKPDTQTTPTTPTKPVVVVPPGTRPSGAPTPPAPTSPTGALPEAPKPTVPATDTDGTKPPKATDLPEEAPAKHFTLAEVTGQPDLKGLTKKETAFWVWYDANSKFWKVRTSAKDGKWTIFRGRVGVPKDKGTIKAVSVDGQDAKDAFKSIANAVSYALRTGPKMTGINVKFDMPAPTCVTFDLYTAGQSTDIVHIGKDATLAGASRFDVCYPAEAAGPAAKK